MNYYSILFPFNTTLIVKVPCMEESVSSLLISHSGIKTVGGIIYNPRQYLSIERIFNPDERHKRVAQDLESALVD